MNLCSRQVIHLVKVFVKRSHFHGIAENVRKTPLGHLKINYGNCMECDICKQ